MLKNIVNFLKLKIYEQHVSHSHLKLKDLKDGEQVVFAVCARFQFKTDVTKAEIFKHCIRHIKNSSNQNEEYSYKFAGCLDPSLCYAFFITDAKSLRKLQTEHRPVWNSSGLNGSSSWCILTDQCLKQLIRELITLEYRCARTPAVVDFFTPFCFDTDEQLRIDVQRNVVFQIECRSYWLDALAYHLRTVLGYCSRWKESNDNESLLLLRKVAQEPFAAFSLGIFTNYSWRINNNDTDIRIRLYTLQSVIDQQHDRCYNRGDNIICSLWVQRKDSVRSEDRFASNYASNASSSASMNGTKKVSFLT